MRLKNRRQSSIVPDVWGRESLFVATANPVHIAALIVNVQISNGISCATSHQCQTGKSEYYVDKYWASIPKFSSLPTDADEKSERFRNPKFPVGTSVLCHAHETEWIEGVVQRHWFRREEWHPGRYAPYQVHLINRSYFYAPNEDKNAIRRNTRDDWIKVHHRFESLKEAKSKASQLKWPACEICGISARDGHQLGRFDDHQLIQVCPSWYARYAGSEL